MSGSETEPTTFRRGDLVRVRKTHKHYLPGDHPQRATVIGFMHAAVKVRWDGRTKPEWHHHSIFEAAE